MTVGQAGADALDALYWRAEILQALYWMRGEGLADAVAPASLASFLAAEPATVDRELRRLTEDGYLVGVDRGAVQYRLTDRGVAEGGRSFHDEFAAMTRPAHGECGPACWCRDPKHAGEPCPSEPAPRTRPEPAPQESPRGS